MYFRTSSQAPYSTGTSTIAETHAGTAGPRVFYSGNWFASYSPDDGATWTFVNPYSQFPSLDGGFCCDQTVIYDRARDLIAWQLQYIYSATTTRGSWRTAFARGATVSSSGWCYYDWNPGSFGLGANLWLDYPHVAVSNNFIWYTANVYNNATPAQWQRTLIFRIPLAAVTTCSGFTYNYFVVSDRFNFTNTQGAFGTMYWASHNSTSSIRIYRWDESSGTIFWDDVTISTWPRNLPYQCPGPDALNWCGRGPNDGRIQTGWVAGGVIGFMWNASQSGTTRPFPYVHVARFRESDRALLSEPIIWHTDNAWAFPAVGVNARGHIAGSIFWGGGSFYPNNNILIVDDISGGPPPWENYFLAGSSQGATSWGDWYSGRQHGRYGNTWAATGQQRTSTEVRSWYAWFGRERDRPPVMSVSGGSISSSGPQGGPFSPTSFTRTLTSSIGTIGYSITNVPSWLTASSTSGTVTAGSPRDITFTVNANANTRPAGTYVNSINFINTSSSLGSTTRTATLTVRPPPVLSVSPSTNMLWSGKQGGPFSPTSFDYVLSTPNDSLTFTIDNLPAWLTASSTSGTIVAGSPRTITFALDTSKANNKDVGTYSRHVRFNNTTNAQGDTTRTATLKIKPRPVLIVRPTDRQDVTGPVGGPFEPDPVVYRLWTDRGTANWSVSGVPPWLNVKPADSGAADMDKSNVRFVLNRRAERLAAGVYRARLLFVNDSNPFQDPLERVIRLTITGAIGATAAAPGALP